MQIYNYSPATLQKMRTTDGNVNNNFRFTTMTEKGEMWVRVVCDVFDHC